MPVRRRSNRRRAPAAAAWAGYMMSGFDFFDDLAGVGLTEEEAGPLAEETWSRIGSDVIAHLDELYRGYHPYERPTWAEQQFGPPKSRRR